MAKTTMADIQKQMELMSQMMEQMKAQNEALQKELETAKKATKLPEIAVKGKVKDGHLYLQMPVGDEFILKMKDGTEVPYLFTTNRSVELQGMEGWKVKVSVFKSPKKA